MNRRKINIVCSECNMPWSDDHANSCQGKTTPKPSSFKEERDTLAQNSEALHLPYNPELSSEFQAFKRGFIACLSSQLVRDMAEALRLADDIIHPEFCGGDYHEPACLKVAEALAAYKKEVEGF